MTISQPISGIERRFQWETLCFDPLYEFDMRSLSGFSLHREVVVGTYHMYGRSISYSYSSYSIHRRPPSMTTAIGKNHFRILPQKAPFQSEIISSHLQWRPKCSSSRTIPTSSFNSPSAIQFPTSCLNPKTAASNWPGFISTLRSATLWRVATCPEKM